MLCTRTYAYTCNDGDKRAYVNAYFRAHAHTGCHPAPTAPYTYSDRNGHRYGIGDAYAHANVDAPSSNRGVK